MAGPRQAAQTNDVEVARARVLVVEARYYDGIANELLAGARRALDAAKVGFDLVSVPGALEIPVAIEIALDGAIGRAAPYDGVIALGCVIRGETSHYDIVAGESARALMGIGVSRRIPVGNGILTVDKEAQAWARARTAEGDKGGAAAKAMLALLALARRQNSDRAR